MTPKQRAFVEAYAGNATEAALKAGYSEKTARFIAAENLTKPYILAAIRERQEKESQSRVASRQERQEFWTNLMRDRKRKDFVRLKAAEALAKSEGDFIERLKVSGDPDEPIVVRWADHA